MKIDAAIDRLAGFKKIADSGIGDCEIVGLDGDSLLVRVNFRNDSPRRKPVLGFAAYEPERKPGRKKGIIKA